ncbi:DUF4142 domain-containing protein [uncultured Sphingomonas sp.]|uniref:DUF4142 domain-containing protein n=1 Tax=uncultured Sphingomonas sp. TaxID=158754 RepID=UPI0035C9A979
MSKILGAMVLAALPVVASAQMAAPMPASTYVMKAGAGDLYERKSSEVVLGSTKNPKLKSFAKMMISDHTTSTADVKAAAMRAGMTPKPPMLDAKQSHDIAALKAAGPMKRDALYITQQKAAHQQALMVQQGYAMNGTVAPLKTAAAKIVPVVQQHIQELDSM